MRLWPFHTRRRVTGLTLSVTGVGVTWANTPSDRDIARDVFAVIEDHRSFYLHYRAGAGYFVISIDDVRRYLSGPIEQCRSDELRNALRGIQAATREFATRMAGEANTPREYEQAR